MPLGTTAKATIASAVFYAAIAGGAISSAAMTASPAPQPAITAQEQSPHMSASNAVVTGTFSGASNHVTTGRADIIKTDTGYALVLSDDFYLDGAPDPVIGFGTDGAYKAASQFTDLSKKRGGQRYDLPANFIPANFNQVFIWCERFSVPLGIANLTAT